MANAIRHTPPLKITVFVQRIGFSGGQPMAMISLAKMLNDVGFDVTLCELWHTGAPPLSMIPAGIKLDYLDAKKRKWPFEKTFQIKTPLMQISRRTRRCFTQKLSDIDADIIYLPNYDSDIYDLFLEYLPSHVIKIIGDHAGSRYEVAFQTGGLPRENVGSRQLFRAVQQFNAVHVVNPLVKNAYARETSAPILAIPNVVPRQPAAGPSDLGSKRIIAVGRLAPIKQFDLLIEAMVILRQWHPRWRLDIFGDGAEKAKCQALIDRYGLTDSVRLCGKTRKVLEEMRASAIHVSSSRYESFGLTIAEAMSVGLPTVSLRQTVGARFLHNDKRGYIAETEDAHGLAKILAAVIQMAETRDPSLLANVENSFDFVSSLFSDQVAEQWRKTLVSLHEVRTQTMR